jgi:hypothetical protein
VSGIDFVGYVFFHTHTRLRKSIKKNFARKASRGMSPLTKASYYGWTKHCNARHLFKTLTDDKRVQKHGHRATGINLPWREKWSRRSLRTKGTGIGWSFQSQKATTEE